MIDLTTPFSKEWHDHGPPCKNRSCIEKNRIYKLGETFIPHCHLEVLYSRFLDLKHGSLSVEVLYRTNSLESSANEEKRFHKIYPLKDLMDVETMAYSDPFQLISTSILPKITKWKGELRAEYWNSL